MKKTPAKKSKGRKPTKRQKIKLLLELLADSHSLKVNRRLRYRLRVLGHKGGLNRRCDERCWDAEGDYCRCVCGGKNHGKGVA